MEWKKFLQRMLKNLKITKKKQSSKSNWKL